MASAKEKSYSHVIWDWNGTLLDDADWCMRQVNHMLAKRNLNTFSTIADYHALFDFPIKDYYQKAGFDFNKDSFEFLTKEYMDLYHSGWAHNCNLHKGAEYTLQEVSSLGVSQSVLSASNQTKLMSQIMHFPISPIFEDILGISDDYAHGKIDLGLMYFQKRQIENALMVGDTMHDFEVASALGIDCLLIANGHQNKERLISCGVPVLADISQVLDYVR